MLHEQTLETCIREHAGISATVLPILSAPACFSAFEDRWDMEDWEDLYAAMDGHGGIIAIFHEGEDGNIVAAEYATDWARRVKVEHMENTLVRLKRAARQVKRERLLAIQDEVLNERRRWAGMEDKYAMSYYHA